MSKETYIGEPMKTLKEIHDGASDMHEAFIRASLKFTKPKFNAAVKYGGTNFEYATLSAIQDCIMLPLLNEGFYPCHEFYNEGGIEWIKTYIRYKNGNTIGNVVLPVAIEGKTMQQIGAQITYLKRYSLSIICNICADGDNDGTEMIGEKIIKQISNIEAHNIRTLIGEDKEAFNMLAKEYGFSKITEITTNKYNEIVAALKLLNVKNNANKEKTNGNS